MNSKNFLLLALLIPAPSLAVDTSTETVKALAYVQSNTPMAKADKAIVQTAMDGDNATRATLRALFSAIAAASSLADLKTRAAAITAPADFTQAQVRNAVQNNLEAGNGN